MEFAKMEIESTRFGTLEVDEVREVWRRSGGGTAKLGTKELAAMFATQDALEADVELTRRLVTGTLPGVVIGAAIRVFVVPGTTVFRLLVAVLLIPLGLWLIGRTLGPARSAPAAEPSPRTITFGHAPGKSRSSALKSTT